MKKILIHRFTFDLNGLNVLFTLNGEKTNLVLCPAATCELLKETGLIEDFSLDANGEPVILFTDNTYPPGYGFEFWSAFIVFFKLSLKMVWKLMQYREDRRQSEEFQQTITYLLYPLQSAA